MEMRHLRYFVVVAEELHFARAAERLHIVQPALSMQIKALEQMLGVRLLKRTKRSVELTEPGRLFLEEARRALEQADRAATVARRAAQGELGRVEIGYSGHAAYSGVFSTTIEAFRRHAPDVELGFHGLHPRTQVEWLLDGRIHIGFITTFVATLPAELQTIWVGVSPLKLALSSDHRLAEYDSLLTSDLAEEPFIVHASGAGHEYGSSFVQKVTGFEPRIGHYAADTMMAVSLVAAGLGVALVPDAISSITLRGKVIYRSVTAAIQIIDIALAYRRDEDTPCVRSFLNLVHERVRADVMLAGTGPGERS